MSAVNVSTIKVSINTLAIATVPCSCAVFTFACACAWGVEPIPASLENKPRFAPWLIAVLIAAPTEPPMIACGVNAYLKIIRNASGRKVIRAKMTINPPNM